MAWKMGGPMKNVVPVALRDAPGATRVEATLDAIAAQIGANPTVTLLSNGVPVRTATLAGSLARAGSALTLPSVIASQSTSAASASTGVREARIIGQDGNVLYGSWGTSNADLIVPGDLVANGTYQHGLIQLGLSVTNTASTGSVNSSARIMSMMKDLNDGSGAGVGPNASSPYWSNFGVRSGNVAYGCYPHGSTVLSWLDPNNAPYEGFLWDYIHPWALLFFEGNASKQNINTATNFRIAVRNCETYFRRISTGQWVQIWGPGNPSYFRAAPATQYYTGGVVDARDAGANGIEFKLPADNSYIVHLTQGSTRTNIAAYKDDIAAVFITYQMRLVPDNPSSVTQDYTSARVVTHVGGDWWPIASGVSSWIGDSGSNVIGMSRIARITPEWQAFSFASIDTAAIIDNANFRARALTSEASFLANMPPLR